MSESREVFIEDRNLMILTMNLFKLSHSSLSNICQILTVSAAPRVWHDVWLAQTTILQRFAHSFVDIISKGLVSR